MRKKYCRHCNGPIELDIGNDWVHSIKNGQYWYNCDNYRAGHLVQTDEGTDAEPFNFEDYYKQLLNEM